MALPRKGQCVPEVVFPASRPPDVNVLVFPDNAAARHLQPHSDPGDGQLGGDGVLADEFPFAQLYGKVQSRLQRRDLVVELVAVERHGRLQAQGIPRPQPQGMSPRSFPVSSSRSQRAPASALAQ